MEKFVVVYLTFINGVAFQNYEGVQKVHRPTFLYERDMHHIVLFFSILFYNWNALGLDSLKCYDFVV